ncbi:MAG: hypothetical protein CEO12_564 [Parcubacteria group bacterium Gr01-1014_46]|nr:MAG: hypothetical protein CEO12_564 [Parcubacteria group bacterium Gr01-1014_46]
MGIDGIPQMPTGESMPTKEEILNKLKSEGLTEENKAMVIRWTELQEAEVKNSRDAILLNIQRIDFYLAVSDDDGAWECAQQAFENAYREGEEDLCEKLRKIYPGLGL